MTRKRLPVGCSRCAANYGACPDVGLGPGAQCLLLSAAWLVFVGAGRSPVESGSLAARDLACLDCFACCWPMRHCFHSTIAGALESSARYLLLQEAIFWVMVFCAGGDLLVMDVAISSTVSK